MSESRESRLARNLYRNLRILAVLTVVFLIVLAAAPFKWHNSEWRDIQKEYNQKARAAGQRPMAVGLQQIWRPEIDLTDRCTSCHVGMGAAAPLPAAENQLLFGRHPQVNHDVSRMGCTLCHRGQGRATRADDAHGYVEHWHDPMLPRAHLESSCGGCHGEAVVTPPLTQVERGQYLFELHGCQACHLVDGVGGDVGPDLSGVALKGFDRQWHIRHLREPTAVVEGSQMMSFGHLSDAEIDAILTYMDTLVGAPRLVRGKAVAVELGCRGCHKIGGVGGDFGGDLAESAKKTVADYDFTAVPGPRTLENWHREHLRRPQEVAPGTTMPAYGLPLDDEGALITYILSLRPPQVPLEELPRLTRLLRLEGHRDFAPDGESLFRAFCAACHGADGRGQVLASLNTTVPNLRNPDVHAVLSEESLAYILTKGRPGRFMPGWDSANGGLKAAELDALMAYLRQDLPQPPDFQEVQRATADLDLGERVFGHDCAACHGGQGEGTDMAPSLTNPEFLFVADDRYLYDTVTRGRTATAMPAHGDYDATTLASLLAWIRHAADPGSDALGRQNGRRRKMTETVQEVLRIYRLEDYRASGSPAYGEVLFQSMCVSCHGEGGRGGLGPAIANPDFLRTASDGFLAGTILLGRGRRPMRPFGPNGLVQLEGREVGDLIVYLRRLASETRAAGPAAFGGRLGYATVQGTVSRGRELYGRLCVGCHGVEGAGGTGPALANPAFLDAVSDGFLQATLVRGRPGTAMRAWARGRFGFGELEPPEINDLVAYIRSWQKHP